MYTRRDSTSVAATVAFDQSDTSTVNSKLFQMAQYTNWGPGYSGRDISQYKYTSAYIHNGGDLPIVLPISANVSAGMLYVSVPDLDYNGNSYGGTWYDKFSTAFLQPNQMNLKYVLQKNVAGGSADTAVWSDVSGTFNSVKIAETTTPNYVGVSKSDLNPLSPGSTTYVARAYYSSNDNDFNWNATTINRTFTGLPEGTYRLGIKYELDYSLNLNLTTGNNATGASTSSPAISIDLYLNQFTAANTPVTFGSFSQKVNVGLNGVQVSGVSGSVVLGEVNDTGVASIYGDALVTGRLTANTTAFSDSRLKDNIQDIENPLELIGSLQPRSFNWNRSVNPYETRDNSYGFIAQEVTGSLPELVGVELREIGHTRNLLTLDQTPIIALNTAGIKALLEKVESLETKVQQLESEASGSQ